MAHAGIRFDFEREVEKLVHAPLLGGQNTQGIAIWGGQVAAIKLKDFLAAWDLRAMQYRIWEYVDRITFIEAGVADYDLLERGRIFGEGGHLSVRRDDDEFLWHFIGNFKGANDAALPGEFEKRDFWQEQPEVRLRCRDEEALLWGEYKETLGCWHDDRVGWADLSYPAPIEARKENPRVKLRYTVFTQDGQVAFVWYKELKNYG